MSHISFQAYYSVSLENKYSNFWYKFIRGKITKNIKMVFFTFVYIIISIVIILIIRIL